MIAQSSVVGAQHAAPPLAKIAAVVLDSKFLLPGLWSSVETMQPSIQQFRLSIKRAESINMNFLLLLKT
jgi:hypothetical protein